ncbi:MULTISPECIES: helix-turn-helix domain-containing protein [Rhizobium]|uniref:Helix-turn-helix transcriptional regulator n=1 Tax=Rhizobium phaseoli TaxID=396 RepID=A0A7X6F2K9_9HYPH|nr:MULTISPECIES: helix-turn-helix transcriptional regulator [Rhizobium]ANL38343.1 XRE family transcriptional regulator protein [Rhizobium phaseoli]ANM02048.1 XRE family transcriptional regulator protein [Rhizobium phaseoli]MDE8757589.1 helix-turn-helix transcriptional regulator [Rhizobium sp. CBK13]NKF11352.1 helix-turn-helix transcriptional regulator [Rhizobium phaseoli]QPK12598.1 helix-turn-helix transcriptional regulator [Rhizobium phaseoli]
MHDRVEKRFASQSPRNTFRAEDDSDQASHPVDVHVGQQLRIRRVHSNLSQTELGQKVGLSYQQVQKYESGKNRISASMLYEIAGGLNVPVGCFFDGLPQPGESATIAPEADERIAFLATAEGRRFVEEILRLPPKLRTRTLAVIRAIAGEEGRAEED